MSYQVVCRECKEPVAGKAHTVLPLGLKGGRTLCMLCIEKQWTKHQPTGPIDFITLYMEANRDNGQVAALSRRVEELEHLLEQLTRPER